VAGAHMCNVRKKVTVDKGKSYQAPRVSFPKIQTTYEKSIMGFKKFTIIQMMVSMFYYPDISHHP
jgi:hypothetical protein